MQIFLFHIHIINTISTNRVIVKFFMVIKESDLILSVIISQTQPSNLFVLVWKPLRFSISIHLPQGPSLCCTQKLTYYHRYTSSFKIQTRVIELFRIIGLLFHSTKNLRIKNVLRRNTLYRLNVSEKNISN